MKTAVFYVKKHAPDNCRGRVLVSLVKESDRFSAAFFASVGHFSTGFFLLLQKMKKVLTLTLIDAKIKADFILSIIHLIK